MQESRWDKVQQIFDSAMQMAPTERGAYIKGACRGDDDLLEEVNTLIGLTGQPAAGGGAPQPFRPDSETGSLVGQTIGPYEVLSKIGVGGMGVVYRARDLRLDRELAIKCLPSHMARDEMARERFITEAKAASRLEHPNICSIFDIGETPGGELYMAMPYYSGQTLGQRIRQSPMPAEEASRVIQQVADGLAAAHRNNIIHRDIKPANIMLTDGAGVKILDFGVAKMSGVELTGTGISVGTAAYMAPEQLMGNKDIDHRVDIWAVGAMLYEMLSGKRPFGGDTIYAVIYSVLYNDKSLDEELADIPDTLRKIIAGCLVREPDKRFASMNELLEALCGSPAPPPPVSHGSHASAPPTELADRSTQGGWDEHTIDTLCELLLPQLGPITRVLVKKTASRSDNLDDLLNGLASHLSDDDRRHNFIRHARARLLSTSKGGGINGLTTRQLQAVTLTEAQLERLETTFSTFVGPIARAMIARARKKFPDYESLCNFLAENIENADERATFLRAVTEK